MLWARQAELILVSVTSLVFFSSHISGSPDNWYFFHLAVIMFEKINKKKNRLILAGIMSHPDAGFVDQLEIQLYSSNLKPLLLLAVSFHDYWWTLSLWIFRVDVVCQSIIPSASYYHHLYLNTIFNLLVRSLCCPALQLLEYVISKMENLHSRVVNQDQFQEMLVYKQ